MDDNLIHIPNDIQQNYPCLDTISLEISNNILIKGTKVFEPTNKTTKFLKNTLLCSPVFLFDWVVVVLKHIH